MSINKSRDKVIITTSIIGILTNVLLAAFKAVIGIVSHSIAVTLDAVNNLSDVLSSLITLVGAKLAGKQPDREHPLGHGRIEYLSAMVVSAIIIYAGILSAVESVKKIITPVIPDYSIISLVIIAVAIIVKFILGRYVKAQGKKVHSESLIASGSDAIFDAIISLSVLISAIVFTISGVSLEAYIGVAISIFIIKAGLGIMTKTLNEILGMRADQATTDNVRQILMNEPAVQGAYDLIMYNYGPDKNYASVKLELPEMMTVKEVDLLTRKMEDCVYTQTGITLTCVGVYPYNTEDEQAVQLRKAVCQAVMAHEWALQIHGFYADLANKEMRFDIVMSFNIAPDEGLKILYQEMQAAYPDYSIHIAPDIDISTTP